MANSNIQIAPIATIEDKILIKPASVLIALLLLVTTTLCFAEDDKYMDGRTLKALCSDYQEASLAEKISEDSTKPYMRCYHYMDGIMDSAMFYERMMRTVSGSRLICMPRTKISTDRAILLTNSYLTAHQDKLDSQAIILIIAALREAYPCNK
jgi:hypothetical protein